MSRSKEEGPTDFWSVISSRSFRERLGLFKYARWAQNLTEEQFIALLCAVGEYGYRADAPLEILHRHAPKDDAPFARAMVGLEFIAEFARSRPSTEEELSKRIRQAVWDAEIVMFRQNVCAKRWKLKDLEAFRQVYGEPALLELLFSGFTQDPPLPRAQQVILGNYLRKLKPRGPQDLASLVRNSLKGWDARVEQLPLYFVEVYGLENLRLVLERLDADTGLSAAGREKLCSYQSWLRTKLKSKSDSREVSPSPLPHHRNGGPEQ